MKTDVTQTSDWGALSEVSILHETAGAGRTSICDNVWVTFFLKKYLLRCCLLLLLLQKCGTLLFNDTEDC